MARYLLQFSVESEKIKDEETCNCRHKTGNQKEKVLVFADGVPLATAPCLGGGDRPALWGPETLYQRCREAPTSEVSDELNSLSEVSADVVNQRADLCQYMWQRRHVCVSFQCDEIVRHPI